jgi:acetoin utilization deacetylase AcuC-like enzyme
VATGYVYAPVFLEHNLPHHPENAQRLKRVLEVLREWKVLDRLVPIEARPAAVQDLRRVHTAAHIERVRQTADRGGGHLDADTYVNARSYDAALVAAGGLLVAAERILAGEVENGFALVRPPGHHATPSRGMGFCLFNNVAVAARYALARLETERVFIADFDVHHGNGTQAVFERDPQVFYFSTHEYPFYPGTGSLKETGRGDGEGTVLNVPLPAGVGDVGYARVYRELAWPLARRFQPDLILVSAGYDAHWQDPLAMMRLSLAGYANMVRELIGMAQELCQGRILFALEGGYHLEVLAHGVLNTFYALMGEEELSDPLGPAPIDEHGVDDLIARLKRTHRLTD